jgi:AcrR family transcriptional regulator
MSSNTDLESIRKPQILMAALLCISESGSSNVTLDDIARKAGLSKGGVAHYYPTKNILYKEAFKEYFNRIFQRSKETMNQCSDPLAKLLSFGWLYNWDDPEVNLGYPLLFDCMAISTHDACVRDLFHEWVNGWIALLQEAVEEGLGKGIFHNLDPESTARAISAIYHGIAVRWYLDRTSHTSEWAVDSFMRAIKGILVTQC